MNFQYILLSIFALMGVISVIVFANPPEKEGSGAIAGAKGEVVIWGTYPENQVAQVLGGFNKEYQDSFKVSYRYFDSARFDTNIVEALASDRGPDILLLPNDLILRHSDKIELVPYTRIPQLTYQSTFIEGAEIFMRSQGLVAIPYAIDPIVMYWNRDLFNNASITLPPKYWEELLILAPKLTKRDLRTQNILQSTVAFGEYENVTNAKDIISMLFLQTGVQIVGVEEGRIVTDLEVSQGEQLTPDQDVVSALRFFMDFSDPRKANYSWSRALPSSREQFLKGELAIHFDYASAYGILKERNPHLNFAVAMVPQVKGNTVEVTFARMHGLAVLKSSQNKETAMIAVQQLLRPEYARPFAEMFNLPPVRRDLLNVSQTDAARAVFYDSAIRARTWLDPRPAASATAFLDMVEGVSSGRLKADNAITLLSSRLRALLKG